MPVCIRKRVEGVCDRKELVREDRKERGEGRDTAEGIAGLLSLRLPAQKAALHPATGGGSCPDELLHLWIMWPWEKTKTHNCTSPAAQESTCAAGDVLLPVLYQGTGRPMLHATASVCMLAKSATGCSMSHSQPPFPL